MVSEDSLLVCFEQLSNSSSLQGSLLLLLRLDDVEGIHHFTSLV